MTPTDILPLLGLDESERIEFKRGALGVKELGEYAVGIGNSGGGVLVLGPRAVLTPMGKDRARALGVRIEREASC